MVQVTFKTSRAATVAGIFFAVVLSCEWQYVQSRDFSYDGNMGPDHWGEQYNACDGKYQSPININMHEVVAKSHLPLKMIGFQGVPETAQILNNGHTVVVSLNFENDVPTIAKGPLKGVYKFAQFHFHWGENDTVGSEDQIDNQTFPAELHMVFYNEDYHDFNEAVQQDDGVAVLAFFYSIEEDDNPKYSEFTMLLDAVREPSTSTVFLNPPTLTELMTDNFDKYFTYVGSLTTPPCSESVTWIDFETPIMISAAQIERFRQLYSHDGNPLTHNFRPIQPLNGRIVYQNIYMATPTDTIEKTDAIDDNLLNQIEPSHAIPYRNPKNSAAIFQKASESLSHIFTLVCFTVLSVIFV